MAAPGIVVERGVPRSASATQLPPRKPPQGEFHCFHANDLNLYTRAWACVSFAWIGPASLCTVGQSLQRASC
jgi:hypothetical protein